MVALSLACLRAWAPATAWGAEIGWSSYLGGANADHGRGVALDASGNVVVVGYTFSSDFPASGGFGTSLAGTSDAFVAKVDASGTTLLWSSYLGGSDDEHGQAVAVDGAGDIYVTGYTASADFPAAGGFDSTSAGVEDAFVAKVSGAGTLLWASYLGGTGPDEGDGIAIDAGGAAVIVGHTLSPDFPASGGFDGVLDGGDDGFVARVLSGGALDWSTFLGGDSDDRASAVATDTAGNAYVTGYTISSDFPTAGGFDAAGGGGVEDAFVTKLATSGPTLVWSSYLGGSAADRGLGIAVDGAGEVYVTGQTASTSFPTTGGFDSTIGGSLDAFVARVDASGAALAWSSYLGGEGADYGFAIAVDASGAPHVAGRTSSADFPADLGFDTTLGGSADGFAAKIDPGGASVTWSSYLGGSGTDTAYGMAIGTAGNLALVGETFSGDFPSVAAFLPALAGGSDAFVTFVVACGNGTCEPGETPCNCPDDCGVDVCGNGCCGATETPCDCAADCTADGCGDGCCGPTETQCGCEADCGADSCGNGCCGPTETECSCADDCAVVCGDGCCATETACTCEADCGADTCGNGCCGPAETGPGCDTYCDADCGADVCGNGCCGPTETACSCEEDCGPDTCNNGCCGATENALECPDDCPSVCGDGFCRGDEGCESCAVDCGQCEKPPESTSSSGCGCRVGTAPDGPARVPVATAALALALLVIRRRRGPCRRAPGRACRWPARGAGTSTTC